MGKGRRGRRVEGVIGGRRGGIKRSGKREWERAEKEEERGSGERVEEGEEKKKMLWALTQRLDKGSQNRSYQNKQVPHEPQIFGIFH